MLDIASMNPLLSIPNVVKFFLTVRGKIHRYNWGAEVPEKKDDERQKDPPYIPASDFICIHGA